ncbi:MAG: MFS transporter, partial [Comamonadaceae bacterium]
MNSIPATHATPPTESGMSASLILLLATGAGLAVATLYYSQPMLGVLGADIGASAR